MVRFFTFTLKHNKEPLGDLLDRLKAAFSKLRKRKEWNRRVDGGVVFLELTWHERHGWHPHLHVIAEGRFFPQQQLAALWKECTGDSHVVNVVAVKDARKAAEYVAKYATKGYSDAILERDDTLREALIILKGRKLSSTFGSWRGLNLHDDEHTNEWVPLASLDDMHRQALAGNVYAEALLRHLQDPNKVPSPGPWEPAKYQIDNGNGQHPPPSKPLHQPQLEFLESDHRFSPWL